MNIIKKRNRRGKALNISNEKSDPCVSLNYNDQFKLPKRIVTFRDGGDGKFTVDVVQLLKKMLENQAKYRKNIEYTQDEMIAMFTVLYNYEIMP